MSAEREALDAIMQLLNASDRHTPLPMWQPSKLAELLTRVADRVRATGREVWGIVDDGDGRSPHWDDDEHLLFTSSTHSSVVDTGVASSVPSRSSPMLSSAASPPVLDDYFPEADAPGSLFIGEDEGRTKVELRTDLLAAVLDELLP